MITVIRLISYVQITFIPTIDTDNFYLYEVALANCELCKFEPVNNSIYTNIFYYSLHTVTVRPFSFFVISYNDIEQLWFKCIVIL